MLGRIISTRLRGVKEALVARPFFSTVVILVFLVVVIPVGNMARLADAPIQESVEFKGCKSGDAALSLWTEGPVKQQLIEFVERVTGTDGVPVEDRIATFDLDGTLMCEKPDYIEVEVAVKRLCELQQSDSNIYSGPLYDAACNGDMNYINANVDDALLTAFEGSYQTDYQDYVEQFLNNAKHPRFKIPYGNLIYEPMGELVNYLRCNGFTVHLVSYSQQGFVRTVSKEEELAPLALGVGRAVDLEYLISPASGVGRLARKHNFLPPTPGGPGKVVVIETRIGKMPILAAGNSMGDAEMLVAATSSTIYPGLGLALVINHNDDTREYKYTDQALLKLAGEKGWLIVGMKDNFLQVFPK